MIDGLQGLAEWRVQTDDHLATLDRVSEEHKEDLEAKRSADNRTLSAIRATQLEHGTKLESIEVKLDGLGRGQGNLGRDVVALQADMGMVKGRLGKVEGRLGKVEGRLGNVEGRLGKVEARLGKVEARLGKIETGITSIQDKLDLLIAESRN